MSAVDSTARTEDNASSVDKGSTNPYNSIIYEPQPPPPRKKTTSLWSYMLPTNVNEHTNNNNINCNQVRLPTTSPSDRNAASIRLMVGDAQASVQHLSDRVDKVLDLQRIEANKLEQVIGRVVQSVERVYTAVAESNAAHTSTLAEALTRCARLEEALVVQSNTINQLSAKCDLVLSQTTQSHTAVLSLAPAIQLETERSSRLLSAETRQWINEHVKETGANLDRVREDLKRAVEAWDGSLALHRQETSVMFSAVLAGITSVAGKAAHTRIPLDEETTINPVRGSETSRSGLAPAHTVDTTPPTTHGPLSSSDLVEEPQAQHAAKNRTSSSRHSQPSPVHGKNSTLFEGRVLVEETQSTALSSVPDEVPPNEAMTFEHDRGFGALNKRASSAFTRSFTNAGSPGFTVQRRPFVQGSHHAPHPSSELQAETRAPTLGRSSPNRGIPSLRLTLNKRAATARVEDVPPGTAKRSRKNKTRVLMDSQELLGMDSSPER
ncbi:hypothetical protein RSOL_209710 [Rhizoctonia solani AG-3 Rhs1AP]|uniref:Uncharacterized protein n=1 Tax=Rhizoctonia solani AG-3 Rhs1AP TaxID=1086054 RepID=X8J7H0_9AGAM|nr:hypothetical protein RSOL_209710 [Rhizoctonia solani AG-3 Rhs1AP]